MICFQCGHQVAESAPSCTNCGQVFGEARKIVRTVTSFQALELRKTRLESMQRELLLATEDVIDGRFEIDSFIGRGVFGQVFKARDRETGRDVALKAIYPKFYETGGARTQLLEKLDLAGRHSATHVLRPSVVTHGDLVISQTMFVTGVSLAKLIRLRRNSGKAFSCEEALPRLRQLQNTVVELYSNGPHGLLKPENILVLADGVRVTDYGFVDAFSTEQRNQALQDGGALAYLAPELRSSEAPATFAADQYALGAIFAEMLSNLPWTSDGLKDARLVDRLTELRVTSSLFDFLTTSTHDDPEERFVNLGEFGKALDHLDGAVLRVDASSEKPAAEAPSGTVVLTVTDQPVLRFDVSDDATQEHALIQDVDTASDLDVEDVSAVEIIPTSQKTSITSEDELLEKAPTKVEARHPKGQGSAITAPPTGRIEPPGQPVDALAQNTKFFPLIAAILILGIGGIWFLLDQLGSKHSKPPIEVSQGKQVTPSNSPSSVSAGLVDGSKAKKTKPVVADVPSSGTAKTEGSIKEKAKGSEGAVQKTTTTTPKSAEMNTKQGTTDIVFKSEVKKAAPTSPKQPVVVASNLGTSTQSAAADLGTKENPVSGKKSSSEGSKGRAIAAQDTNLKSAKAPVERQVTGQTKKQGKKKTTTTVKQKTTKTLAATKAKKRSVKDSFSMANLKESARKNEPKAVKDVVDVVTKCPSGMRLLTTKRFPKGSRKQNKLIGSVAAQLAKAGGAYCIDQYEYPGANRRPKTNVTLTTAKSLCREAGKRLCRSSEWNRGCIGRGGSAFPYGRKFNPSACATEDAEEEEREVGRTGQFRKCRSISGAYDMVGNVAEWTSDGRVRGGDVASSDEEASCRYSEGRSPSFRGSTVGFRCCSDFK